MITSAVKPLAGTKSLKSRRLARVVTSKYHSIRNEISLVDQSSLSKTEKKARKDVLGQKLEDIGGTNRYQEASIISTQHFKTSRWVLGCVDRHMSEYSDRLKANHDKKEEEETEECNDGDGGDGDVDQKKNKRKKKSLLEVLEVGAINIQLQQASNRLRVRSIDVNSQHPLIEEKDFFDVRRRGGACIRIREMS